MRGRLIPVLVCLLCGTAFAQAPAPPRRPAVAPAKAATPPAPASSGMPVIGCPSLANLRQLMRTTGDDQAKAVSILSDEHADHLGCGTVPRERVVSLADHVTLGGHSYDCLGLRDTGICHWTLAGAIPTPEPQAAAGRVPSPSPTGPDKPRR